MEEEKVFTGKTYEEAVNNALLSMPGLTRDDVEITVLEEGKKKLFHSSDWKISVSQKKSDGARAAEFINGLLKILNIAGESEVVSEDGNIKIDVKTESSARVIGKRGDVLDAIQTMAGAVANIGREEYIKVVVDCENYRSQRENTLIELAHKVAKKAVETGRKVTLEPMNPYERRIIHSALLDSEEVKTSSEGREPQRYVAVIPNNAKPGDKGIRYGAKRDNRGGKREKRPFKQGGERGGRRERNDRGDRNRKGGDRNRSARPSGGGNRGKKEIHFGTFLGNSGNKEGE